MGNYMIFILTQPNYPVPVINDGAAAFVIQDTIKLIDSKNIKVISLYDERMNSFPYDKSKFLFINRKSLIFRIVKKFFSKVLNHMLVYPINLSIYRDTFIGLMGYSLIYRPRILIIHSTRCEWLLNIKKALNFLNTKIVWYHHTSEDQETDTDHLSKFRYIDAHIFVSSYSKEKFISKVIPFDNYATKKSFLVRNGIDIDLFQFNPGYKNEIRRKYQIPEKTQVILYIGKITPRKGLRNLLEALSYIPDSLSKTLTLLIVGSADYFNEEKTEYINDMEKMASKLNSRTIFTGYISHNEIIKYYCAADLLIFPSIGDEGMPLTILEAQAVGLPVIASEVGGINEIIQHGVNGYLYPQNSKPKEISTYIEELLKSPSVRRYFSKNAKIKILKNFSGESMVRDLKKVIDNL